VKIQYKIIVLQSK